MERSEISLHEVRLYKTLSEKEWFTVKTVAEKAKIAARTASLHLKRLSDLGIVDVAEVYPGHRYRLSNKADKRNSGYLNRLKQACEIFGELK